MDVGGSCRMNWIPRCLRQVSVAIARIIITLTSPDNHIKFKSSPVNAAFDFL